MLKEQLKKLKGLFSNTKKKHNHFYEKDVWRVACEELKGKLPKGYTVYGEILGYVPGEISMIQKGYDYGCKEGEHKLYVYRITFTNEDGIVFELSTKQIQEFCKRVDLKALHVFYHGRAMDMYPELIPSVSFMTEAEETGAVSHWRQQFVERLEKDYNEKECFMCNNRVPEEGIVLRIESMFEFEAYKLKSFAFLEKESKDLDSGASSLEEEN